MKKKLLLFISLLLASVLLLCACSGSGGNQNIDDSDKESGTNNIQNDPTNKPSDNNIQITVNFNLNINADEGKDADGFTWENNFSEITITGYIGSSNELTVPKTINNKPVTKIADGAMEGFTGLKSIVIPGSVKSIVGVFKGCTGLETVTIENSGLQIMDRAFENCTSLKTVNIPTTVTAMNYTFNGCSALNCDITIPDGVTVLSGTFKSCSSLTNIALGKGVTDLTGTFVNCTSLQSIVIPENATNLSGTFDGCTALMNVNIPNSVTELFRTFNGCTSLVNIELPESITNLDYTFQNCSSLKQIVIPSSVTSMYRAFKNCVSLTDATFADVSNYIEYAGSAFLGCTSLKKLDMPQDSDFNTYGCIALEELTIRTTSDSYDLSEINFAYTPSLTRVSIISSAEDFHLYANREYESSYTMLTDTSHKWYNEMREIAIAAKSNGYRYYSSTLDDGTECRKISKYDKDSHWYSDEITVEPKYEEFRNGCQIITKEYVPALFGDDLTPGVLLITEMSTEYVSGYFNGEEDDICGAEYYEDCAYPETIEINGVNYVCGLH